MGLEGLKSVPCIRFRQGSGFWFWKLSAAEAGGWGYGAGGFGFRGFNTSKSKTLRVFAGLEFRAFGFLIPFFGGEIFLQTTRSPKSQSLNPKLENRSPKPFTLNPTPKP